MVRILLRQPFLPSVVRAFGHFLPSVVRAFGHDIISRRKALRNAMTK
jgi:hypothetical protein